MIGLNELAAAGFLGYPGGCAHCHRTAPRRIIEHAPWIRAAGSIEKARSDK